MVHRQIHFKGEFPKNNGGHEVSYSGDALEVATYFESKGAWDSLMEFAAKCDVTAYCDGDLMAKLQDKQSNHMSSIYSTNSNRQVLVASVDANKHGMKYINEKRGWSDIEVEVEEIFLGLPGKENVIQAVLDELGTLFPCQFMRTQ